MADGQVLIDTKINTAGVTKGAEAIKKAMEQTAKTVNKAAENMENAFKDTKYKEAFESLPKSFQSAFSQIEMIRANDLASSQQKAKQIARVFEDLGDDQVSAQKRAWAIIEAESADGSRKVIDDLRDISKEAEKTGEGVSDGFKDVFGASVTADLVVSGLKELGRMTLEFGKQAVESAAQIAASNAQFEQTFKGIEDIARKSLSAIAEETGITATRMQDSYSAIFAFSKSIGADQTQALDIASRAMVAAADSAAYYDRSIEEATETLQSFLKGNYENDAALGIAATETTRNAKANEMYAKSFIELSEAQKVDVLLAMVEAGNAASGAMGQAAREADSWTNVTGELQEAWRQFQASLGTPVLKALIPVIQSITDSIQGLIEKTASAELQESMDSFRQSVEDIDAAFISESKSIEQNALMADYYRARLQALEAEGFEPNTAASREYEHAIAALNALYPEMNLQVDAQTGLLDENSRAQLANVEAMKQKALFAAIEQQYTDMLSAQADAIISVQNAENALSEAQAARSAVEAQLTEQTGKSADELVRMYAAQLNAAAGYTAMDESAAVLTQDQMNLVQQLVAFDTEIRSLEGGIQAGNETIAEYDTRIKELASSFEQTSAKATEAADTIDSGFSAPTQESVEQTGNVMEESLSNPADTMQEAWQDKAGWFESDVASPIKSSTEDMGQTMLSTNADMETETISSWERMVAAVESAIDRMQSKINSLHGKNVNISTSGGASDASMPSYAPAAMDAVPFGIPQLATGAVIPPNAPFYAVLGDQKSGVNIEAPLDTIKQAVAEVVTDIVVRNEIIFEGELAPFARILYPEIQTEARRVGKSLAEEVIM